MVGEAWSEESLAQIPNEFFQTLRTLFERFFRPFRTEGPRAFFCLLAQSWAFFCLLAQSFGGLGLETSPPTAGDPEATAFSDRKFCTRCSFVGLECGAQWCCYSALFVMDVQKWRMPMMLSFQSVYYDCCAEVACMAWVHDLPFGASWIHRGMERQTPSAKPLVLTLSDEREVPGFTPPLHIACLRPN